MSLHLHVVALFHISRSLTIEGSLSSLKHLKDDIASASKGTECGLAFADYHDMLAGDVIECFERKEGPADLTPIDDDDDDSVF